MDQRAALDGRRWQAEMLLMPVQHFVGTYAESASSVGSRSVWSALWRGTQLRCPACGTGAMFRAYLKVNDQCPACGTELHHHRADDAPPYFTILIVGHIVVAAALTVEMNLSPPLWFGMTAWPLLALVLSLLLLPVVKGALVGLQWALRMHGFDAAMPATGTPYIDFDPMHQGSGHDDGT